MSNRHPFSGTCSFCGEGPEHPDHIKGHGLATNDTGNHALLAGGLVGLFMEEGQRLPGFIGVQGPLTDSQGNYLDTITIVMRSGLYDVTVRPQQ